MPTTAGTGNEVARGAIAERRLERVARAMGLASGGDIPAPIADMNARLGLPRGLAAMQVEPGWTERIVAGALADHCHATNPRVASADDYRELLATSM